MNIFSNEYCCKAMKTAIMVNKAIEISKDEKRVITVSDRSISQHFSFCPFCATPIDEESK